MKPVIEGIRKEEHNQSHSRKHEEKRAKASPSSIMCGGKFYPNRNNHFTL